MNVDVTSRIRLNCVTDADRFSLRPQQDGHFELFDRDNGQVVGTLRHTGAAAHELEIYNGKGGTTAILTSPTGLKYFVLPGGHLKVQDIEIDLPGPQLAASPDRAPSPQRQGGPQQHTKQAMILGAGLATRFEPISGQNTGYSKPAIPLVGTKSVIECIANALAVDGFTHLVINTFFMPTSLKAGLARSNATQIRYIDESEPSGTAGGLRKMLTDPQYQNMLATDQPIMVVQGDAVTDANFSELMEAHVANNALVTLGCQIVPEKDVDKFGIIVTDRSGADGQSGRITGFQEKPKASEAKSRMGNTGFYIFSPKAYPIIREAYEALLVKAQAKAAAGGQPQPTETLFDFAMDIFPEILRRTNEDPSLGTFWAQVVEGYWSDIGNPQQYLESIHDIYAGKANVDLGGQPEAYYKKGILYWDGAQALAEQEGAELEGNILVALPFKA